jgi:putative DNA methylase
MENQNITRPGKYIEYDFPLHEVNRLAVREGNSKKPIYRMHKWWARRLSCVFRTILLASAIDWEEWDRLEPWRRDAEGYFVDKEGRRITRPEDYHRRVREERPEMHQPTDRWLKRKPTAWERLYYRLDDEANAVVERAFKGKTVLDPFMGGGTTVIEALRLGADAVGVDLNPVAWFVTKKETDGCDPAALEAAFHQVEAAVAKEIKAYYKTTCPCCGEQADVMYAFWVKQARCSALDCGKVVPLFNSFVLATVAAGKKKGAGVPANAVGIPGMLLVAGPESGLRVLVCPACELVYASKEKMGESSTCPRCRHSFMPEQGYAGEGDFTCPHCGTADKILESAKRQGWLPFRLFALELYCRACDYKGYKQAEESDHMLYEEARQRYEAERESLNIPSQRIPNDGAKTKVDADLEGHGYHYWRDLFNARQLLLLARLRDAILQVKDADAREYLIQAWSGSLNYNTMLCRYHASKRHIVETFSSHAYVPKPTPCENNVWGTELGTGTFSTFYNQVCEALEYARAPSDWLYLSDSDRTNVSTNDSILPSHEKVVLGCFSSENLIQLDSFVADLVATDPPYLGNVMYAELSDLFYVWLRTALHGAYPNIFGPELTPKTEEVVETVTRGHGAPFLTKDENFFAAGLTRIFAEAGRHLADDGLLVFTFHHQANEAWGSVLRTVLDAGFFIAAVYPVHAEMRTSLHIQDKANISYDAVIVCRKQTQEPPRANWLDLEDQIYLKARDLVEMLNDPARRLLPEDIYVITIGQCLEVYSRHTFQGRSYAHRNGHTVTIGEALDGSEEKGIRGIAEIVDQLVEESEGSLWPAGLDPYTRFWVINFLGQSELAYDRLKRRLTNNPHINLAELERRQLVQVTGSKIRVLSPAQRKEYLRGLFAGIDWEQPTLPEFDLVITHDATQVDQLHYLYSLVQSGQSAAHLAARWGQDPLLPALARSIAAHLDPTHKEQRIYAQLGELLAGTLTQQRF